MIIRQYSLFIIGLNYTRTSSDKIIIAEFG